MADNHEQVLESERGDGDEVSDRDLVDAAQGGDTAAFDELVSRHRGKVYGSLLKLTKNDADAWDLAQDAFLKAWKALPKFENRSAFTTWLYRIAHNVGYDWLRKKKIEGGVEFDETIGRESIDPASHTAPRAPARPDKAVGQAELGQTIHEAIAQLSENHRSIILLREVEGCSYQEIAEQVDCSIGTVMSRLHHARKNLQELLQPTYESYRSGTA